MTIRTNSIFDGETMKDEDGVVVGMRFIEEVLLGFERYLYVTCP